MIEDAKIWGVWVGLEQVGFCLNENEADDLATELEDDKTTIEDVTVQIDLHLFRR